MKIVAYARTSFGPFIPEAIQTDEGLVLGNTDLVSEWESINPMPIDDNQWIGVLPDGTVEVFNKDQKLRWSMEVSQRTVSRIGSYGLKDRIKVLNACAKLAGADLSKVLSKIDRSSSQTFEEAFRRKMSG